MDITVYQCRREDGFTLLELLVVCMLISLLLVVSVPAFRDSVLNDPLRSAGRRIIGSIGAVRGLAVQEQQSYILFVDLDENDIWFRKEKEAATKDGEPVKRGQVKIDEDVNLRDYWGKSSGTMSRGVKKIWISEKGYVEQSVLHLENDDGEQLSLLLSSFIPGVEVRDGYYEPE